MFLLTRRNHSQVETGWVSPPLEEEAQRGRTRDRTSVERSGCQCQRAGWFPLFSCQGLLTCTLKNRITLLLQYCQGKKREAREAEERECVCAWTEDREEWSGEEEWDVSEEERAENQEHTSAREYAVDA